MVSSLDEAIEKAGGAGAVAALCDFKSPRAIYKWLAKGALPRTEYTGETDYADRMAKASRGAFTAKQLRDQFRPNTESKSAA